jgi:hypothetical protein
MSKISPPITIDRFQSLRGIRRTRKLDYSQQHAGPTEPAEDEAGRVHHSPIEAALELPRERAMSVRMRRTSSIAYGFWCVLWPDRTMCSDVAPPRCELQYGTTPSEEFGASPLPRSPMMV